MFQGMEYIYEVYKEKSFSKAADNLFISQPSLSATVKRIERQIGYPVFDRSTKPLGLTECGEKYIESVELIMAKEKEFSNFVNDWGKLKKGKLVLGGSSFFSSWVLPPIMGEFIHRYPLINVSVVEESTVKLRQLLQSGAIDFMIDNGEFDEKMFLSCLYHEEHLLLAVPRRFAVNDQVKSYQISEESIRNGTFMNQDVSVVPLEVFREQPFIVLKPENDTRERAMNLCRESGFTPCIMFELDQQMTSYNITSSGMGISFIGDSLISRVPDNHQVVYYKLETKASHRRISFYWKKGRYVSRAMEEFLKIVKEKQ